MARLLTRARLGWGSLGLIVAGLLVWQFVQAGAGTTDPTDATRHLSHFAVVLDSAILVLREGLETILVLAVLTASMRGDGRRERAGAPAGRLDRDHSHPRRRS